jgi:hypothetical protein
VNVLAADAVGNVYLATTAEYSSGGSIMRLGTNGVVTRWVGTGVLGYSGDGGLATNAQISGPLAMAVSAAGTLFIADSANACVRKVNTNNIITTFAGVGQGGFWGDGGAATNASIEEPSALALDAHGDLFIADQGNHCVREVNASGTITTVAGTGCLRSGMDGAPALEFFLTPTTLACDGSGNLLLGDTVGNRICEVPLASGWPVFLWPSAIAADAGTYAVIVTNSAGRTTNSATVTVTQPTTAEGWIQAGLQSMNAWDLDDAHLAFEQAVALSPTNEEANARACVSRFFLIPRQPAVSNYLATHFEIAPCKLYAYNWIADPEYDTNGVMEILDSSLAVVGDILGDSAFNTNVDFASGDLINLFNTNIMPSILACDTNLARITDPTYTITFSTNDTHLTNAVRFDRGDFLLLRSLAHLFALGSDTTLAFNFDFELDQILTLYKNKQLSLQGFLTNYPDFLAGTANMSAEIAASKVAFTNGAQFYFEGSGFIRTNRSAGTIGLFNFDPSVTNLEAEFREYLNEAVTSVYEPVVFDPTNNYSVYLGAYFNSTNSLRQFLPTFDGNTYVPDSLPDYTFNGLIQNVPAWQVEALLRGVLDFSPAGIYSTNLTDYSLGAPGGWALMFVPTNGQATLIACATNVTEYDPVTYLTDTNLSDTLYQQPIFNNLSSSGSWEWSQFTNGYYSLDLEADFGIPSTSSLSGYFSDVNWDGDYNLPACSAVNGEFHDVAGLYSGRWTNTTTGVKGPIQAILADDGTFGFAMLSTTNVVDGGMGRFSGDAFSGCISSRKFAVTATLNLTGLAIGGTLVSPRTNEVFSVVRTEFIAGDTLPTITKAPANQAGAVGGRVTFTVAAAGSPPLCYQWYSNGAAILGATSTNLVLRGLTASAIAATYSVQVHNVVGEAGASANVETSTSSAGVFSIAKSAKGTFQFSLMDPPATGSIVLETSTNLTIWLPVATNSVTGSLDFDFGATNRPARFFRAKVGP